MDDYHAYTSTTGDGETERGGSGCSYGCLPGIISVLTILYLVGKVFV